ncbi:Dyp-type peroxidase [Rhodovibrionaceae bacterium A322]
MSTGTPQTGFITDNRQAALFLTMTVQGSEQAVVRVRDVFANLPGRVADLAAATGDVEAVVGFGSDFWDRLSPAQRPKELRPFPALSDGPRQAPSTGGDIHLHIRSDRRDLCFELGRSVVEALGEAVSVNEEVDGFRYLDKRDLIGFVDGTENPELERRKEVTLIAKDDPDFAGGSYVIVQRYVHKMKDWNALPVAQQEKTVGRTKADDIEFEGDDQPPYSHVSRNGLKEDGVKLEILRQNMPWATTQQQGTYFIGYAKSPHPTEAMLRSMFIADDDGTYDKLLDYTDAVTGATFFVPSQEVLKALA